MLFLQLTMHHIFLYDIDNHFDGTAIEYVGNNVRAKSVLPPWFCKLRPRILSPAGSLRHPSRNDQQLTPELTFGDGESRMNIRLLSLFAFAPAVRRRVASTCPPSILQHIMVYSIHPHQITPNPDHPP